MKSININHLNDIFYCTLKTITIIITLQSHTLKNKAISQRTSKMLNYNYPVYYLGIVYTHLSTDWLHAFLLSECKGSGFLM